MKDKLYSESEIMTKLSYTEPLDGGDSTKERYRYLQWLADTNAIKELKPARAIFIPDGATNGDVIKAMFPDYKQRAHINNGYFEMYFNNDIRDASYMRVSKEFWNAPFRVESEE